MKRIKTNGIWFENQQNQKIFFRGINLGGSSKVPVRPNGATHIRDNFFNHKNVSFVGRPFPLEEAEEHFSRIRSWGFNLIRFLITWEAIEHAGPGQYDQEYLEYVERIIEMAGKYDLFIFIDPHQDVWSRFTGGDGAPGWTLEKIGFNLENIHECSAAVVHNIMGDPYPQMIWPTNNQKLAAASMFTLFFAGNDFAPELKIDGEPVQEFLQNHYINAVAQVASRLKKFDYVIGYDSLNEPSKGFVGVEDIRKPFGRLKVGEMPTPWQSMLLGCGHPQEIEVWKLGRFGFRRSGTVLAGKEKVCVWDSEADCIWRRQGVWTEDDKSQPILLNPYYFSKANGENIDFDKDYLRPFVKRYANAMRAIDPETIIFVEGDAESPPPIWTEEDSPGIVNASHWYDGLTLFTKNFTPYFTMDIDSERPVFGRKNVFQVFYRQLNAIKEHSLTQMGGVPTLLGEFGIPYDMNKKNAYETNDFSRQAEALDTYYRIIESTFLNSTIWNYTADNNNQYGDLWNHEDLSIFSRDQQNIPSDINSGGRALSAFVRPYVEKLEGDPISQQFNRKRKEFTFAFSTNDRGFAEIFIPKYQYPRGVRVEASDGQYTFNESTQSLVYYPDINVTSHLIRVLPM